MDFTSDIVVRIGILMGLAVVFSILAKLLRQPLMIAYIFTGLAAGPLALDLFSRDKELFNVFSQLGILLLLFVVGLSLNITYLRRIGKVALVTGLGQVVFTELIGFLLLSALGFGRGSALILALAITFSSTIIITKLLGEKRQTDSLYGRHAIGLMLVQDVLAIIMLVFLTTAPVGSIPFFPAAGAFLAKGLLLFAGALLTSRRVLPVIMDHVARSQEFLFVCSLAWCFGITAIAHAIGFSLEIGAVIAGLTLGSSLYQPEIAARVRPLRDFFLILFFIILGSQMNTAVIEPALVPALVLSLFILVGNPAILYILFRCMKFTRRNSFLAGLTAAQVSEFGFVLMAVGVAAGYATEHDRAVFTLVAMCTIFVSSYLITYGEQIFAAIEPLFSRGVPDHRRQKEDTERSYRIWVIGYHRIGWKICAALKDHGASFAVIDFDPEAIAKLRRQHIPAFYGDVHDIEFLAHVGIRRAKTVISTIPDPESQHVLLRYVRAHAPSAFIIANAPEAKHLTSLYAAGADYVMTPHLLGGGWIARLIEKSQITRRNLRALRKEQEAEIALGLPIEHL